MKLEFILYLFELVLCFLNVNCIYMRLINEKFKITKLKILLAFIFSAISTVLIYFNFATIKLISYILMIIIFNFSFSNRSLKRVIFYSIYIWVIGTIIDMLLMLIYTLIIPLKLLDFYIIKCLATIILQVIYNLIFMPSFNVKLIEKLYYVFSKIGSYFYFIILIIFVYFDLNIFFASGYNQMIRFISMCLLILMFIYLKIKNLYLIKFYKEFCMFLEQNNNCYVNDINKFRIFKHNMIHSLQSIRTYSTNKSLVLIDQLIKEVYNLSIVDKNISAMPIGINGIIYQKIDSINNFNCHITMYNEINYDIFDVVDVKTYYNACKAIGVVVDNAIDAILKIDDYDCRILNILILDNKDYIEFIITNSFSNFLDIEKIGNINYSSKSHTRGLGIYSIINNKKIPITISIKNNLFVSNIKILKEPVI